MNAKDIVILICEKKTPAPYWMHTRGIYADLSDWPRAVDYYVKCPECGNVHGFYKSLADARSKRLCPGCDFKNTEKLKKEIAKVDEAEEIPAERFDPDIPADPKGEVKRYIGGDWIDLARWELSKELGEQVEFDPEHYANKDVDIEEPDTVTKVVFITADSDINYIVYKSEDEAITEAVKESVSSFEDEPSIYHEWLQHYINTDKLRDTLLPDEENMTRENFDEEHSDYEDKAKAMVEAGKLEEEDFFDENGDFKKLTAEGERQIDLAVDEWVEQTAKERLEDPMEYLQELGYGDDEGMKKAMEWGGVDYQKAAEDAVRNDGWQNTLLRYDGKSINLPGGAVAVRD